MKTLSFLLLLAITILFVGIYKLHGAGPSKPCAAKGDDADPKIQALDKLKNRAITPTAFANNVTVNALLKSRKPTDFDQTKGVALDGYIYLSEQEYSESCNCHSPYVADWDNHIFLAPSAITSSKAQAMVIEATPHTRKLQPAYTLKFFEALKGKHVRITGYLMYDFKHTGDIGFSRGTVWEVHPITKVEVLK